MWNQSAMRAGRIRKALARLYCFNGKDVMTLGDWLDAHRAELTHKTTWVQTYTAKRVRLDRPELTQAKTWYTVWRGDTGLDIPKIVYDSLDLPTVRPQAAAGDAPAEGSEDSFPYHACADCPHRAACSEDQPDAWFDDHCPAR